MEVIKNWVVTIMSVIIFITFVEIIIPSGKSKKYINVVVGLLIIVVILNPLLHIFREGVNFSDTVVQASNQIEYVTTVNRVENMQYHQEALVLEIYKNNLASQMKNRIEKTTPYIVKNIELDIEKESKDFGLIKGVELYLEHQGTSAKSSKGIEPVRVDVSLNKNSSVQTLSQASNEGRAIKNDFSSFYNLSEENINIYIYNKKTSEED